MTKGIVAEYSKGFKVAGVWGDGAGTDAGSVARGAMEGGLDLREGESRECGENLAAVAFTFGGKVECRMGRFPLGAKGRFWFGH